MRSLLLVGIWIGLATCLFAQTEVTIESDQTVTVDVNKEDDGTRKIKIVKNENGEEKIIEWTDSGEIPSDVRKMLKEEDIDIHILQGSRGQGSKYPSHRQKKKVMIIDDGDGEAFEWHGERDLPPYIKELLDEHDIDIDIDHRGHKRMRKGERRRPIRDRTKLVPSDTYIGAQIESADAAARVTGIMKGAPADKGGLQVGDHIKSINGARTRSMESLIQLLHFFEPGDEVEIRYIRDGQERTSKLTLGKRPGGRI